jgi:hypothetical protein
MKRAILAMGALCLAALSPAASAATIYLCRAYSGGEFWSSVHCNQKSALIVRMANVPDGVPFEQQVRIVEGHLQRTEVRNRQEDQERGRARQCAQLKVERDQIWSRYSNWQYQPNEVVGPDRTRWKAIEVEQQRLNCPQR